MKRAFSLLPSRFEDGRHECFKAGLRAIGYDVIEGASQQPQRDDLVLTWNAYGPSYDATRRFIAAGGDALVFEEAYIRNIGGEKYFACALGGHNGFGRWRVGSPERWQSWDIPVAPWREDGDHILVCGQRGFGYNAMAMPNTWPDDIARELRSATDRPLWYRPHPTRRAVMPKGGYDRVLDFDEPIAGHLADAWAVVVFTSNAATDALLAGIPAIFCGPAIVARQAARRGIAVVEKPFMGDRAPAFVELSWAQWSTREFEDGTAFGKLLG